MNASQPVERVVALLREASYEPLPQPVAIADIPFEFSAVLVAGSTLDLVVVVDTITDTDASSIRHRVEGLGRALDLVDSRRPLTIVLVGPEPAPELHLALTRVARVLIVGVPSGERELRESLAILLPLEIVTAAEMPESWRAAREKLLATHPEAVELLEAAKVGPDEVADATRRHLLTNSSERGESS